MPFLLVEILNFQGTAHLIGVGSLSYVRNNFRFQGWATSTSGLVMYNDGQSVMNLSMTNGSICNLYAVWKQIMYDTAVILSSNATYLYTYNQNFIDSYAVKKICDTAIDLSYFKGVSFTVIQTFAQEDHRLNGVELCLSASNDSWTDSAIQLAASYVDPDNNTHSINTTGQTLTLNFNGTSGTVYLYIGTKSYAYDGNIGYGNAFWNLKDVTLIART